MPSRALPALARIATPALAIGIFAGLLAPPLASMLQPLLLPSIIAMLTLALVRLDWRAVAAQARRPGIVGLAVGWQLLLSPVLAYAIGAAVGLPAGLLVALTLNAAASPIMSSAAFAQLLDLDAPLSIVVVVIGTLLLPLTIPPLAYWLIDLEMAVSPAAFAARVGWFIALPFAAAIIIRRIASEATLARHDDAIAGATVIALLVFAIAVMDGMMARLLADPATVLLFLAVAILANVGLQAAALGLFWMAGRRMAASIALMSGNRNMALIFALAGGLGGEDLLLYLAVAQVPIYVLPALAKPIYRSLIGSGLKS